MVLSSSAVVVSNFKVSMAQETVEGGNRILGGKRWLFTLHSDQSFLNTPELRGSRIGTHPVGKKTHDIHIRNNHTGVFYDYVINKFKNFYFKHIKLLTEANMSSQEKITDKKAGISNPNSSLKHK